MTAAPNPFLDAPRRWLPLALLGGFYVLIGIIFTGYDEPGWGRSLVRPWVWILVGMSAMATSTTRRLSEVSLMGLAFLASERLVTLLVVWAMGDGGLLLPTYYLPILLVIWMIARLPPGTSPRF